MPQSVQITRYKAFDGKLFETRKEAEAHEAANYVDLLAGRSRQSVEDALALKPEADALTAAIERAALEIKRLRRVRADAEAEAHAAAPQHPPLDP